MAWTRFSPALLLCSTLVMPGCDSDDVESPDDMELGLPDDETPVDEPGEDPTEDPADPGDEPGQDPTEDPAGPPPPPQQPKPDATQLCADASWGGDACTTEDGEEGTSYCIMVDGEEFDTPCSTVAPECDPGDNWDMGCVGSICYWNGQTFELFSWEEPDCNTPLVVNFDGGPIEFAPAAAASFDLSTNGSCQSTDWPTAPWLALDRDGDGFIRDGGELFGSATRMSAGGFAEHGFAALAELDTNRDGKITAADERFGELVLWSDLDDDRIGSYAELRPVSETSLVSIDLGFSRRAHCDGQGNCGFERAAFEYRTPQGNLALGEVVDVHVACR